MTIEFYAINESVTEGFIDSLIDVWERIEKLFVSPDYFRQGVGQRLVRLAIDEYKIHCIDVNGQNPNAFAFYQKMGFQVFERTETDELGNPFPILKMKLQLWNR